MDTHEKKKRSVQNRSVSLSHSHPLPPLYCENWEYARTTHPLTLIPYQAKVCSYEYRLLLPGLNLNKLMELRPSPNVYTVPGYLRCHHRQHQQSLARLHFLRTSSPSLPARVPDFQVVCIRMEVKKHRHINHFPGLSVEI